MGRRIISAETAELLLESFRTRPGSFKPAADRAGVAPQTAKRAWIHGLARSCPDAKYHRPFEQILADEQSATRARLVDEEERVSLLASRAEAERRYQANQKAIQDVTEERAQEAILVRHARGASLALLATVTGIAAGANVLGKKVREALELRAQDPSPLSVAEAKSVTTLLGRLTTSLRQCNEAAHKAMEMSRLLLGEPTSIVGHVNLEEVPVEEARKRLEAAQRALDTITQAGATSLDDSPADPNLH